MTKGGKRKGAWRKPAPYKTKTVSFRIKVEHEPIIRQTVKEKVAELNDSKLHLVIAPQ